MVEILNGSGIVLRGIYIFKFHVNFSRFLAVFSEKYVNFITELSVAKV